MSCWITWWGTEFESVTPSVSGNDIGRSCFRILDLSCGELSTDVHERMSMSRAVVTQLVTPDIAAPVSPGPGTYLVRAYGCLIQPPSRSAGALLTEGQGTTE